MGFHDYIWVGAMLWAYWATEWIAELLYGKEYGPIAGMIGGLLFGGCLIYFWIRDAKRFAEAKEEIDWL